MKTSGEIYESSQIHNEPLVNLSNDENDSAVCVPYEVPELEYMYGCAATVMGMLLGYYDKYGYNGYNVSNLIKGTVEVDARGLDGNMYDMDAFDTVLGSAVASKEYVKRFYNQSAADEYKYTYVNDKPELNISEWNCIADFLGTGQYWRGNGDLSTRIIFADLSTIKNYKQTDKITSGDISIEIPIQYKDMLYGLDLYVQQAGYKLDDELTKTVKTSNNGGDFDFEDYKAEIDAGRLVMIHIDQHTMLGYGYDDETKEIIFDDTYHHDQRMTWGGSYYYSNQSRRLQGVSVIAFDTEGMKVKRPVDDPVIEADTTEWTNSVVTLTAEFDPSATVNEFSYDQNTWFEYKKGVKVESNKTVYFRSLNSKGESSNTVWYEVTNIDKNAPELKITVPDLEGFAKSALIMAQLSDPESGAGSLEYSLDNKTWYVCSNGGVTVSDNGVVYFRGTDKAGNVTYEKIDVDFIDGVAPSITVTGNDSVALRKGSITLNATVDDSVSGVDRIEYRIDNGSWFSYTPEEGVKVEENGIVYFRAIDKAGNSRTVETEIDCLDNEAPKLEIYCSTTDEDAYEVFLMARAFDSANGSIKIEYSYDETNWTVGSTVKVNKNDDVYFKATDEAGNETTKRKEVTNIVSIPEFSSASVSWSAVSGIENYAVEYRREDHSGVLAIETDGKGVDFLALPNGSYTCQVKAGENVIESSIEEKRGRSFSAETQTISSLENGQTDVFFAQVKGRWGWGYAAEHETGSDSWIDERVILSGKNRFTDVFKGSDDASILVMTDDFNGDALFLDDSYSVLPEDITQNIARLSQIKEIRAGAGDDVVDMTSDMTSSELEYEFDDSARMTIYGGDGNDVIWAARDVKNMLFGDGGNDRLAGGSEEDYIIGGTGDDSMHGGGGDDIFCFCEDWGKDIVEQLEGGKITLWFESGSESNWNENTLTYTDGANSVKVSGVSKDNITLKFGDDKSQLYDELAGAGCFDGAASQKIFEDKNGGMLA